MLTATTNYKPQTLNAIVIGADIGGSHITAAQVDLTAKQLIPASLKRLPVDSLAPTADVIHTWANAIKEAAQQTPFTQICLAIPGPFDYEKGICLIQDQEKYPMLYGLNVKELLATELNIAAEAIYLNNDAACFLQGEVFCGSLRGYEKAIGVTLGTGLGSAIFENGQARSADRWNMPLLKGMAEDYLSSRWFVKKYSAITGHSISGVRELTALAPANDWVNSLFDEFGHNLAAFVTRFIAETKSKAVVIGGNIAQAYPLFKNNLLAGVHSRFPEVLIAPSVLGEPAALIGAAGFRSPVQEIVQKDK